MKLVAAIPTRTNWQMLGPLIYQLDTLDISTVIYDNGHESDEAHALLAERDVVDAHGWPFYRMWNDAWRTAHESGFDAVALLNDDITLHPQSLDVAAGIMRANPMLGIVGLNYLRPVADGVDYQVGVKTVSGSFRHGGIGGHAFLVRANTWGVVPPIDERYALWYGDDELFRNMENHGFPLGLAMGAPVDHATSTTSVQFPELLARTGQDRALFESKFGTE